MHEIVSLGLDVSTAIVGIAITNKQGDYKLAHVDLTSYEGRWDKADAFEQELKIIMQGELFKDATHLFIEDAAMKFSSGSTSALTIATLMRFNGVASWIARSITGLDPTYIACTHARKVCGMKMQPAKKVGIDHKEQTFRWMREHELKDYPFPTHEVQRGKNKGQTLFDAHCYDMVDAYVISRAGMIELH